MDGKITETEHLLKATQLAIANALDFGAIFNNQLIGDIVNKKIESQEDVTPITILSLVEAVITQHTSITISGIKLMTLYLTDIVSLGMIIEDQKLGFDLYNPDVDIVTELYKRYDFTNAITVLTNKYGDEDSKAVLQKYNHMLEDINNLINPTLDYYIKPEVLEQYGEIKHKQINDDIFFILFQHVELIEVLSKYKDFTLTLDQIKEAYYKRIRDSIILELTDETLDTK